MLEVVEVAGVFKLVFTDVVGDGVDDIFSHRTVSLH